MRWCRHYLDKGAPLAELDCSRRVCIRKLFRKHERVSHGRVNDRVVKRNSLSFGRERLRFL